MISGREDGFSLVEVLVAFAILALALATLFSAFGTGAKLSAAATERTRAVLHAESILASLKLAVAAEPVSLEGEFEDGFRWEADVVRAGTQEEREAWFAAAHDISVRVFWGASANERKVEFHATRLSPKGVE